MIFVIQFKLQIHDDDDIFEVVCQPNVKLKSVREVNLSFSCVSAPVASNGSCSICQDWKVDGKGGRGLHGHERSLGLIPAASNLLFVRRNQIQNIAHHY